MIESPRRSATTAPLKKTSARSATASTSWVSLETTRQATPLRGQRLDLSIDVDAGADIDALRRLDQQQHAAVTHQPAGKHDLLLIAAAQDAHGAGQHGRRDLDLARGGDDLLALAPGGQQRPVPNASGLPRRRHTDVGAGGELGEQGVVHAVVGHDADAAAARHPRSPGGDRLVDRHRPRRHPPACRHRRRGPPRHVPIPSSRTAPRSRRAER